ncbi:hypothetical protein AAC03nite_14870 [Alicyclobacillus acidoterrestris]|uniref:NUDIX domain-containing protein n=1 Tax=Alicyclobacillus suci TaxID=2816080 RepID=UPI0011965E14|nr:NUDIX domain-containing protein [Alicyclobacillus suci]GEO25702.1 hypothetical protein AAC03nite_14870 [Alicyclobacillus acidoterrestris]
MREQMKPWPKAFGFHMDEDKARARPHSVLVFPVLFHNIVWVHHSRRGWEVPGGKLESGEDVLSAVRRESYEEAGLTLGHISWVAEYQILVEGQAVPKWVYLADVIDVQARPTWSEIDDVRLFHPNLSPDMAKVFDYISPIMKDIVYERAWPVVARAAKIGSVEEACL